MLSPVIKFSVPVQISRRRIFIFKQFLFIKSETTFCSVHTFWCSVGEANHCCLCASCYTDCFHPCLSKRSLNHRVGKDYTGFLVQHPAQCRISLKIPWQVIIQLLLEVGQWGGEFTTSLGSWCHCWTTVTVKIFFPLQQAHPHPLELCVEVGEPSQNALQHGRVGCSVEGWIKWNSFFCLSTNAENDFPLNQPFL